MIFGKQNTGGGILVVWFDTVPNDVRTLAEQFYAKPVEIRLFSRGTLDATRTRELTDQMLAAGLPL